MEKCCRCGKSCLLQKALQSSLPGMSVIACPSKLQYAALMCSCSKPAWRLSNLCHRSIIALDQPHTSTDKLNLQQCWPLGMIIPQHDSVMLRQERIAPCNKEPNIDFVIPSMGRSEPALKDCRKLDTYAAGATQMQ